MPRAMPVAVVAFSSSCSAPSRRVTWFFSHSVEPGLDLLARRPGEVLLDQQAQARFDRLLAGGQTRHRLADPAQQSVMGQDEGVVAGEHDARGARLDLAGKGLHRRHVQGFRLRPAGLRVSGKAETLQHSDVLALDEHIARRGDLSLQHRILPQTTHQHTRAPIHEPAGEPLVQSVRQLVLYKTRHPLPMLGIGQPVGTVGDEGPGPDLADAGRQRVDLAVGPVERRQLGAIPVAVEPAVPHQPQIQGCGEIGVLRPGRSCGNRAIRRPPRAVRPPRGPAPAP